MPVVGCHRIFQRRWLRKISGFAMSLSSWAHFELCKPGTMLLQPSEHALPTIKADYVAMRNMIYVDYPSFEDILLTIKQLESEINTL